MIRLILIISVKDLIPLMIEAHTSVSLRIGTSARGAIPGQTVTSTLGNGRTTDHMAEVPSHGPKA